MDQLPNRAEPAPATSTPLDFLLDPASLLAILWRGRGIIAASMFVCAALTFFYLLYATRIYQASVKLLVLQNGGVPLSTANGDATRLVQGPEDDIPTHAMIVSSPIVLQRAVEAVGTKNLPSLNVSGDMDSIVRQVAENLSVVRPDRQAKILQILYRARSPEEAVRVVRAVAESYRDFLEEVYTQSNGDVIVLMSRAQKDLNRELKELEQKYVEFRQKTPYLTGNNEGRPLVQLRIDEWDKAAREAMVRGVQLKSQLELGRELSKEGIGLWSIAYAMDQVASNGGSLGGRTQGIGPAPPSDYIRMLTNEQQQMSERYGPQSTKVKEIQEKILAAQSQNRKARGRVEDTEVNDLLTSIEGSLKAIEKMRSEIHERFEADLADAKQADIDRLVESNLKNELARQQSLFDTVVEQLKRAKIVGDYSGTRSQIIEPPNALPKAIKPQGSVSMVMALAAGAMLGTIATLVMELLDPRVRSVAEMRRVLPIPVLGQLPYVPDSQAPRTAPVGLICQAMPRSPSAEAYRLIRAGIDLARRSREARVVMVTSAVHGEGNTTFACNLAVTQARAGRRVLLVDANLRAPGIHRTFGVSGERGLVHLLRDLMPLARVVQTTSVKNLDLVASGPEVPNPAELLSTHELAELVDRLRQGYDTVVLDTPPLLSVADSSILGAVVDGIVLVSRVSTSKRTDILRAVETLHGLGTPVLGAVVNATAPEPVVWPWPTIAPLSTTSPGHAATLGSLSGEIPYDPRITFGAVSPEGHESGNGLFRSTLDLTDEAGR